MDQILITGAAGFIGHHLVNKIVNKRYNFILLDDYSRGNKDRTFKNLVNSDNIIFLNRDLTKPFVIKEKKIKYVFHLAARIGVKNVISKPSETINDNISMLINTINAVKKNNKKTKIIFFSTSEVYSPLIQNKIAKFPLKEDVDLLIKKKFHPRDSYYISKIVGEKIVELSGLKYVNLRPHNIYGPRMGYSHVIPELIKKFKDKKNKIIKIQSPSHKRAFCYIDDAINQIVELSFNNSNNNNVFNIGNNKEEIKIFDLARKIKKILRNEKKIIKGINTSGSPQRRVPDLSKINPVIKNKDFINLEMGIKNYLQWLIKK